MNSLHKLLDQLLAGEFPSYANNPRPDERQVNDIATGIVLTAKHSICFSFGNTIKYRWLLKQESVSINEHPPNDCCYLEFSDTNHDYAVLFNGSYEKKVYTFFINHKDKISYIGQAQVIDDRARVRHGDEEIIINALFSTNALFKVINLPTVVFETQKPSIKLNKKRLKKGKSKIYETKTLIINLPKQRTKINDQGGTHASPRVHFRRAHQRRLSNGRIVNVKSSIVGDKEKGMIEKDYKVEARVLH